MSLKAKNMKNLAIVYCGDQAYSINFASMSKNDAFDLIKNSVIIDKREYYKVKINDATYKYLCGYLNNDLIQPLCVILPQMNGYI